MEKYYKAIDMINWKDFSLNKKLNINVCELKIWNNRCAAIAFSAPCKSICQNFVPLAEDLV